MMTEAAEKPTGPRGTRMTTLAELQAEYGVEPGAQPRATPRAPRVFREDMRCPKCKEVTLQVTERIPVTPYKRSVVSGSFTCPECNGTADGLTRWCENCRHHGYILKFDTRWFDYSCGACALEARRANYR